MPPAARNKNDYGRTGRAIWWGEVGMFISWLVGLFPHLTQTSILLIAAVITLIASAYAG